MAENDPNQNPPNDPSPPAEGANPPQPNGQPAGERTFTQADLDRIVNERLARDRQSRSARPAPPATPADALTLLQLRDDFDDATTGLTLDGGQRKFLRGLVMDKRPSDVATFVKETIDMLGLGKTPQPSTPASSPAATPPGSPPAPQGHPVTAGPPPSPPAPRDDIPYHAMSPAQRAAYVAKHGTIATKNKIFSEMANVRVTGVRRS
jgi:hypothetical protein